MCVLTVCQRPDYQIGLEEDQGHAFWHCYVTGPAPPGLIHRLRRDWDTLFEMQGRDGYTISIHPHGGSVEKHAKFCRLMGFKPFTTLRCPDGVTRHIFVRRA